MIGDKKGSYHEHEHKFSDGNTSTGHDTLSSSSEAIRQSENAREQNECSHGHHKQFPSVIRGGGDSLWNRIEPLNKGGQTMGTVEEVEASLAQQVKRHEVLKSIIKALDELRKDDFEGAEWCLEQLAE
jgi:hypothetical protein